RDNNVRDRHLILRVDIVLDHRSLNRYHSPHMDPLQPLLAQHQQNDRNCRNCDDRPDNFFPRHATPINNINKQLDAQPGAHAAPRATLAAESLHLLFSRCVVFSRCVGGISFPPPNPGANADNEMGIKEGADEIANRTSRRSLLRQIAGASVALPLAPWKALPAWAHASAQQPARRRNEPAPPPSPFSPEDDQ